MALLLDHEFPELALDQDVNTQRFLDSVQHIPPFFDCLGSTVFMPIKSDVSGNIEKLRAVYLTDPVRLSTLRGLVIHERDAGDAEWPRSGATLALMWLKRGLRFIQTLLQSLVDGVRDERHPNHMTVNATLAYTASLRRYHGWLVRGVFSAAVHGAPYRSDFLRALSKGAAVPEELCLEQIALFLRNFTPHVDAIYRLYDELGAELDYTA
ncbi:glycolipid transfer protein [Petromyzon marinus]|uniref:Glycolipid transfer protein isoform X1 n=1 Tax=Petromyzon marinus TaxID=7757 RepID=A0AAJ7UI21_PETMA|nr:glycolipid transfer protein isoform X1 [Petromyzon marinus]XP_032836861.1 glycolipid transfer protein isoform X1 [Petromyzon marinus]XP_032836862.1 glycolipid transfer protein isoform X2 [Petromyzon marinus]